MDGDAGAQAGHGNLATAGLALFAVALMWSLPFPQPRQYLPLRIFYSE